MMLNMKRVAHTHGFADGGAEEGETEATGGVVAIGDGSTSETKPVSATSFWTGLLRTGIGMILLFTGLY